MLTRQRVQLFGEGSHNDVVLHNVRHLLLQVLLVECDQGIGAGVPNLKQRFSLATIPSRALVKDEVSAACIN